MRHQPVRRHRHPVRIANPARHHPPADRALHPAQRNQPRQLPAEPAAQPAPRRKHCKAQHRDQPDKPAKLPVAPLPPVNELELGKAHALVLQLVLGRVPVLVELGRPIRRIHRRQRPRHRAPFGNREARIRQPRRPAHQHGRINKQAQHDQPGPDPACGIRGNCALCHAA